MEINEFKEIMNENAKKINIEFNDKQLEQFFEYMNLLIEWNEKINLTAITEPKEIIIKHFIDSLTINKYIEKNNKIVDVGTGAGFPGIPIKIYRPEVEVTLVDSLNKRINFLNEVISKLGLEKINIQKALLDLLQLSLLQYQIFLYIFYFLQILLPLHE